MAPEESVKPVPSSHFRFVAEHVRPVELHSEVVCEAPYIFRRQAVKAPLHVGDMFAESHFNVGRQHGLPWAETQRSHCGDFLVAVLPKCPGRNSKLSTDGLHRLVLERR